MSDRNYGPIPLWVYVIFFGLTALGLISMILVARSFRVSTARAIEDADRLSRRLEEEERALSLQDEQNEAAWRRQDEAAHRNDDWET